MNANQNQNQNQLPFHGTSYHNFINAIKSPATKAGYETSLKRYLNHIKKTGIDDLLVNTEPRYIESQIIDYIMSLRDKGVSYATMLFLITPIFTFYQLNDVILNRKKVSRYLGEFKRVVKDAAYTTEQIQMALQNADSRIRMIILILASTGARIGSLPSLTLGNLTKIPRFNLYKITFYESTNNEYYTFTTRECALTGIDNYLSYRQRCGEKISFNDNETMQKWEPSNVPLLRMQFDVNDLLQVKNPRPMTISALRVALTQHLVRSGLRVIEHPTAPESPKRVRKSVSLSTGFRKRVISTFIEAQLNHEIRELIVDHTTQLDQSYFRPTEDQVLQEYLKAESLLTIDPSLRLQTEIQTLRVERSSWEAIREELDEIKALLNQG
jgi:integrase